MINNVVRNDGLLSLLSEFFDVKKETIFTVSITIFVFCAGTSVTLLINWFKDRQHRKSYKNTINLLLNDLGRVCKKQHLATISNIKSYSLPDGKNIGVHQMVYVPLQFLNKMDYSLFIKYYVRCCNKRQKVKAATRLFQIIGYANIFESDNEEKITMYLNVFKPMQDIYIKNMLSLEVFGQTLDNFEVSDYDFKHDLIKAFELWNIKHIDNNFRNSFTNLVSPLLDVLKKYPVEAASANLFPILNECRFAYSEITHIDYMMKEHLKNFAHQNKRVYRDIEIILLILNDKKKKKCF